MATIVGYAFLALLAGVGYMSYNNSMASFEMQKSMSNVREVSNLNYYTEISDEIADPGNYTFNKQHHPIIHEGSGPFGTTRYMHLDTGAYTFPTFGSEQTFYSHY